MEKGWFMSMVVPPASKRDDRAPIPLKHVRVHDPFWKPRQVLLVSTTLPMQCKKLHDYHHVTNFAVAAGESPLHYHGVFYFDSDLYKWIEATTYALFYYENDALARELESIISLVVKAQQTDGYINTFFTTMFNDERMKYFYAMHELYCGGHLIEAAVARHELTGKDDLLGVARRFVDFLLAFEDARDSPRFVPGHQEIELALIRMYRATGERKYLDLASRFIEKRGKDPRVGRTALANGRALLSLLKRRDLALARYDAEHGVMPKLDLQLASEVPVTLMDKLRFACLNLNGKYVQQHAPFREQRVPTGHAVRATYWYAAITDLYMETRDASLLSVLESLWDHIVTKRMYITGGIGSVPVIEGWGRDYELNNCKAYCETCAAIGSFFWNWRMLQATGDPKYGDLMETLLYNGILAGWSQDGTRYHYTNPLASKQGMVRKEWFVCPCCPPNIARVVASLGQYVALVDTAGSIYINQYVGSTITIPANARMHDGLALSIESRFPFEGKVVVTFVSGSLPASLYLRMPPWAVHPAISAEDRVISLHPTVPRSFMPIPGPFEPGTSITIDFHPCSRFVRQDPRVKATRGRVAVARGPLVYCTELADNPGFLFDGATIDASRPLVDVYDELLWGGITKIVASGFAN
nr:glycoside hydrolase family 127 protein [Candidatus Sigynarchaeota archaeon]